MDWAEAIVKDLAVVALATLGGKILELRSNRRTLRVLRGIRRDLAEEREENEQFRGRTRRKLRVHGTQIHQAHQRIDRHDERADLNTRLAAGTTS